MPLIAPTISIAKRNCLVRFEDPGPAVPDGDGGWVPGWVALDPPALMCEVRPLTATDFEFTVPGTILAVASHVITGPYHPDVTSKTLIRYWDERRQVERQFHVRSVANRNERDREMVIFAAEVVP